MSFLDTFEKVSLNSNAPAVSISNYGLTFNKAVLERMKSPSFVDLFVDKNRKMLAIRQSDSSSSIPFSTNNAKKVNARINNKEFARQLFELMGWEYKSISYKVPGQWHDDDHIFVFDMTQAIENALSGKDESK